MDGREYLTKLISDRLTMARQRPRQQSAAIVNRSEIRGVALGLVAASALSQNDMERILADLDLTLESMDLHNQVRFGLSGTTTAHITAAHFRKTTEDTGASQPRNLPEDGAAPTLVRVHPLEGSTAVIFGQSATLISAEIWSTSIRIRLAFPHLRAAATDLHRLHHRWRAWDDQGTQYRERGSESSESEGFLTQSRILEPAPSHSASRLDIAAPNPTGEDRFTITLH